MLKLTLKETIAAHREMWKWLAENPAAKKAEYPPLRELYAKGLYSEIPLNRCYLCEYDRNKQKTEEEESFMRKCKHCPLDWNVSKNITSYMCEESFYGKWAVYKIRPATRKQLAETIAGLPEKKE